MTHTLITWSHNFGKKPAPCIPVRNRFKQQVAVWLLFLLFAMPAWPAQMAQEVVLVLDNSGSMRKNDPGFLIKNAVTVFVETLDSNVRLAVLIFDQDVNWVVPFTEINDTSKPEILSSLDRIKYDGLYTDSRSAMALAADELNQGAQAGTKKIIVFLTDGIVDTGDPEQDAESDAWLRGEFTAIAGENSISVIGVAFTEKSDQTLVQALADETGGTYYNVPGAQDLEAMFSQAALLIKSMSAEDETQEDSIVDDASAEDQDASLEQPAAVEEDVQEDEYEQLPTAMEAASTEVLEPVVTDMAEEPEESISDETAAQGSVPDETQEHQDTSNELQAGDESRMSAPAVDKSKLLYLVGALVIIGIIGLFFLLFSRSRKKEDSASAATQIIRTVNQTPEEPMPQAYLDDLDKVTGKPRHTLRARKTVITRTKEIEDTTAEHIRIPRDTISRLHAAIEYDSGVFWLSDFESSNGTYQNDHKVTGRQRLHDGDQIRFDTFHFRFVAPGSQASDATVIHPVAGGNESRTVVTPAKN